MDHSTIVYNCVWPGETLQRKFFFFLFIFFFCFFFTVSVQQGKINLKFWNRTYWNQSQLDVFFAYSFPFPEFIAIELIKTNKLTESQWVVCKTDFSKFGDNMATMYAINLPNWKGTNTQTHTHTLWKTTKEQTMEIESFCNYLWKIKTKKKLMKLDRPISQKKIFWIVQLD